MISVYNEADLIPSNADELIDYIPQGGGGTDFECNWDYMKQNGIEPQEVYYGSQMVIHLVVGVMNFIVILVLIVRSSEEDIVPSGPSAYYTKEANKKAA